MSIYPSPFIRNVSIEYSVDTKQKVTIDIFDLKGRQLISLVNGKKAEGTYKAVWNGRDTRGYKMGTQMYIIRFQSGKYSKSTKIYKIR